MGRYLQILQWSADVFEEFAGWFNGKTSPRAPVLAQLRPGAHPFLGPPRTAHPGADPVTAEAYSHEVVSFGFWAGDRNVRHPAYYSYTAPEPDGLRQRPLEPEGAEWATQRGGSLALLDYDAVRATADPRQTLLDFLQSSFEAGASLTGWDLVGTKTAWCPVPDDHLARLGLPAQGDQDSA